MLVICNFSKRILKRKEGLGTVEIVIIAAVLVGMALIFRRQIFGIFTNIMNQINTSLINEDLTLPPQPTLLPSFTPPPTT